MRWKSRWSDQHTDTDTLKQQLQTEGFSAYQWTGRPGGPISTISTRKTRLYACYPAQQTSRSLTRREPSRAATGLMYRRTPTIQLLSRAKNRWSS